MDYACGLRREEKGREREETRREERRDTEILERDFRERERERERGQGWVTVTEKCNGKNIEETKREREGIHTFKIDEGGIVISQEAVLASHFQLIWNTRRRCRDRDSHCATSKTDGQRWG